MSEIKLMQGDCFELDEKYFDIAKQRIENGFYQKEITDDELKQFPLLNI